MSKFLCNKTSVLGHCQIFGCILMLSLFLNVIDTSDTYAYSASITTSSSVSLDVLPSGDGISIHEESINIQSNCRNGYNLTVATPSGSSLYNGGNSSNPAAFTAVDGSSALNTSTNTNKWGYTLTADASGSTVFSPLSTTASTLKTTSQTASATNINDTFPIYYGLKVDNTVAPGTYQMANNGAVVYYLTMDATCDSYTVAFNANGGTGTTTEQEIKPGVTAKLNSETFNAPVGASYTDADNNTITGNSDKLWTFWGWNTEVDGTGDWYKDKEEVTDLATTGETFNLYAQWKQATLADLVASPSGTNKTINHNTMQDMSSAACWNSDKFTAIGTPYGQATLTDNRDGTNRTYTVARLPDGYCWMTQNLNLGASTPITLTSDDTDLEENTTFTLPASDPSDFATGTTSANINKATVLNDMTIPNYTVNGTTYSNKTTAYYSYAAATANTNTYNNTAEAEVSSSICPKNWDLPTAMHYYTLRTKGSITTYNNTGASYAGKNAGNEPYFFVYGGYRKAAGSTMNSTYFSSPTTYGYLWTANNGSYLYGRATSIYSSYGLSSSTTGANYYKYYGLGIRCIANMDNTKSKITYVNTDTGETQTQTVGIKGEATTVQIQLPTTWTKTGYGLSGWDTNSSGDNIVYLNDETITLSNDLTLYTAWRPAYTIQYNGNGANAGVMTNVKHIVTFENDIFDLFASNYSKTNYGFAGWSFDPNAQPGGSSRIYGPNEALTAPSGTMGETKTLYAVWVQSAGNLQDWQGCSSMNVGDVTALKDTRDNNVYTVGKLADGNCRMMENLRLDNTYSSDSTKAQGFGGVFTGLANPENSNFTSVTTANSLYSTANITGDYIQNRFPRFNNTNTKSRNTNPRAIDDRSNATSAHATNLNTNIYSYGNYYTWPAAIANTEIHIQANSAITSICPSGWRLPEGGDNQSLDMALGGGGYSGDETVSRSWRAYPNNYIFSGGFSGSSLYDLYDAYGSYWTSGSWSQDAWSDSAYDFELKIYNGEQSTITSSYSKKYQGRTVRCVAASDLEIKLILNDGTGRIGGRLYGKAGSTVTLPLLFNNGHRVVWNTASDGSGTDYDGSYTINSSATTGTTLYAKWVPMYTIQYDGNGADTGSMTNVKHTNVFENDIFDLFASNYSKNNYGFAGWSFDPNAQPGGASKIYGPNEAITAPAGTLGETKTLYAVWVQSAGNLQDWQGCSNMNTGDVTALKDTRDNNVYTVGKLADENCWMMENLRLDNTYSSDSTKAQGFGGAFTGLANPENSNFTSVTTANSLYSTTNITGDYPEYRFPRYNSVNTGSRDTNPSAIDDRSSATSAHITSLSTNIYSYGNYYTWAAAKANTEYYNTANASEAVNTSLCPSGWKLPKGRSSGSGMVSGGFSYLGSKLGATTNNTASSRIWRTYPNNIVFSGLYYKSSSQDKGGYARYWSATTNDRSTAYNFYISNTNLYPGTSTYEKTRGVSIRCLVNN